MPQFKFVLFTSLLLISSCFLFAQKIEVKNGKILLEGKPFLKIEKIIGDGGRLSPDFSVQALGGEELIFFRCDTSLHPGNQEPSSWYEITFRKSAKRAYISLGISFIAHQIAKLIIRTNLVMNDNIAPFAEDEFCKSYPPLMPLLAKVPYTMTHRNRRFRIDLEEDGTIVQQKPIGFYKFGYEIDDEGDNHTIVFYVPSGEIVAQAHRDENNPFVFNLYTLKDRKNHLLELSVRYLNELSKFLVDNLYL